jgi:hypothetical protein
MFLIGYIYLDMTEWVRAMSKEDSMESKSALLNILYDARNSSEETRETLGLFFQFIDQSWNQSLAENIFLAFCKFTGDNDGYFCQGRDISETNQGCSRVMDLGSFYNRYIDDRDYAWGIIKPGQELEPYQIAIFGENDISIRKEGKMIRGGKPFAWVTKTAALAEITKLLPQQEWGSEIRNQLGLNHHRLVDIVYIEIQYHLDTVKNANLKSPTFLEGYSCLGDFYEPVYRSFKAEDGWGCAVNLATYENGLPEAVHRPIEFDEGFTLRYIGKASASNQSFNNEKLLNSFSPPWYHNLSQDLIELINYNFQVTIGG